MSKPKPAARLAKRIHLIFKTIVELVRRGGGGGGGICQGEVPED